MSKTLTTKDWIMISAYLDNRLSPAEIEKIEIRTKNDPSFKKALEEIAYTRKMLRSLPQKHAPRNFTLSPAKTRAPIRNPWLQPALKYVSIAAALITVVIFVSPFLLFGMPSAVSQRYDANTLTAEKGAESTAILESPVIINWNPVLGMGGGGGAPDSGMVYAGGMGGGPISEEPAAEGEVVITETEVPTFEATPASEEEAPSIAAVPSTEEAPALAAPQISGERSVQEDTAEDLSTLILGLPDPSEQGKVIEPEQTVKRGSGESFSMRMIFVFITGGIALLSGIIALFLRKR